MRLSLLTLLVLTLTAGGLLYLNIRGTPTPYVHGINGNLELTWFNLPGWPWRIQSFSPQRWYEVKELPPYAPTDSLSYRYLYSSIAADAAVALAILLTAGTLTEISVRRHRRRTPQNPKLET